MITYCDRVLVLKKLCVKILLYYTKGDNDSPVFFHVDMKGNNDQYEVLDVDLFILLIMNIHYLYAVFDHTEGT